MSIHPTQKPQQPGPLVSIIERDPGAVFENILNAALTMGEIMITPAASKALTTTVGDSGVTDTNNYPSNIPFRTTVPTTAIESRTLAEACGVALTSPFDNTSNSADLPGATRIAHAGVLLTPPIPALMDDDAPLTHWGRTFAGIDGSTEARMAYAGSAKVFDFRGERTINVSSYNLAYPEAMQAIAIPHAQCFALASHLAAMRATARHRVAAWRLLPPTHAQLDPETLAVAPRWNLRKGFDALTHGPEAAGKLTLKGVGNMHLFTNLAWLTHWDMIDWETFCIIGRPGKEPEREFWGVGHASTMIGEVRATIAAFHFQTVYACLVPALIAFMYQQPRIIARLRKPHEEMISRFLSIPVSPLVREFLNQLLATWKAATQSADDTIFWSALPGMANVQKIDPTREGVPGISILSDLEAKLWVEQLVETIDMVANSLFAGALVPDSYAPGWAGGPGVALFGDMYTRTAAKCKWEPITLPKTNGDTPYPVSFTSLATPPLVIGYGRLGSSTGGAVSLDVPHQVALNRVLPEASHAVSNYQTLIDQDWSNRPIMTFSRHPGYDFRATVEASEMAAYKLVPLSWLRGDVPDPMAIITSPADMARVLNITPDMVSQFLTTTAQDSYLIMGGVPETVSIDDRGELVLGKVNAPRCTSFYTSQLEGIDAPEGLALPLDPATIGRLLLPVMNCWEEPRSASGGAGTFRSAFLASLPVTIQLLLENTATREATTQLLGYRGKGGSTTWDGAMPALVLLKDSEILAPVCIMPERPASFSKEPTKGVHPLPRMQVMGDASYTLRVASRDRLRYLIDQERPSGGDVSGYALNLAVRVGMRKVAKGSDGGVALTKVGETPAALGALKTPESKA